MINRKNLPLVVTCGLFLISFLIGGIQFDSFFTVRVFINLFHDNAFLALTAIGMTFAIIAGGIDLSVGSMIALTGISAAVLMESYGWHPLAVFPVLLFCGTLFGAAMGVLIHVYKIQAFIITLAGMFLARALALVISEESIAINHPFYDAIADFGIQLPGNGFISLSIIILFIVLGVAIIIAHYTGFGSQIYAIGGNSQSAVLMGVPIGKTIVGIYAMSGFLATLSGIVFTFYTFSGYSLGGAAVELDAIAAVVIGGTLLTGGRGYVFGTLIGVLIYGTIQTYINFDGTLNSWWTKIVMGFLLFLCIILQRILSDKRFLKSAF